jgi:hypothetical protein
MFKIPANLRFLSVLLVFSGLIAGCMAPHAWQTPREMSAVLTEAKQWPQLATNLYARVEPGRMPEAISMLQDCAWRSIGKEQVATFTPTLSQPAEDQQQPYLVRGVTYSSRPVWTDLRLDPPTGRLVVKQASYNGEMLMPGYTRSEPNALVVFLSKPPAAVYPNAVLGGDGKGLWAPITDEQT